MQRVHGLAAAVVIAGTMLSGGSAAAQDWKRDYPYCATQGGGSGYQNCYYPSMGACRAAVSAVGGFCHVNPRFRAATYGYADDGPPRRVKRKKRRHYR